MVYAIPISRPRINYFIGLVKINLAKKLMYCYVIEQFEAFSFLKGWQSVNVSSDRKYIMVMK